MKILRLFAAGLMCLGVGIGSVKVAEAWEGHQPMKMFGFIKRLNLTDAQKDQGLKIIKEHKDEMRQSADALKNSRKALFDAVNSVEFDEQAVRAAARNVAAAQEELIVKRSLVVHELKGILNEEQLAKVKDAAGKLGERIEKRIGHRREMVDLWLDSHTAS